MRLEQLVAAGLDQGASRASRVLEVVVEGADGDAGLGGDLVHVRGGQPLVGEELLGRVEDAAAEVCFALLLAGSEPSFQKVNAHSCFVFLVQHVKLSSTVCV